MTLKKIKHTTYFARLMRIQLQQNEELHEVCMIMHSYKMKTRIVSLLKTHKTHKHDWKRNREKKNIALTLSLITGLAPLETRKVAVLKSPLQQAWMKAVIAYYSHTTSNTDKYHRYWFLEQQKTYLSFILRIHIHMFFVNQTNNFIEVSIVSSCDQIFSRHFLFLFQ